MKKSYIIAYFLLSFIVGVGLRSVVVFDSIYFFTLALIGIIGAVLVWALSEHSEFNKTQRHLSKKFLSAVLLIGPLFLFLGWLRLETALLPACEDSLVTHRVGQNSILSYQENEDIPITCLNGISGELFGEIIKEPDLRKRSIQYVLDIENYKGNLLVFGSLFPVYEFGDTLKLKCRFEAPEYIENFDYPSFLAKEGVYTVCYQPEKFDYVSHRDYPVYSLIGIKQQFIELKHGFKLVIDQSVSYPASSFLNSIILGLRREVPADVKNNFSRTCTSHIMAISGLHIVILSAIVFSIFRYIGLKKRKAFLFVVLFLLLFIGLIGFRASAIRAGFFGLIVILAEVIERPRRMLNLILLAASLLLLFNPLLLAFDIGFQLSFAAVFGLSYLAPFFKKWLRWMPEMKIGVRQILVMTLSAQVFVLPLIVYHFGSLSLIAPFANVLILPTIPWIMGFGVGIILLGSLWLALGQIVGFFAQIGVSYIFIITKFFAAIPFAQMDVQMPLWSVVIIYGMIGLLIHKQTRYLLASSCIALFKKVTTSLDTQIIPTRDSGIIQEEVDLAYFEAGENETKNAQGMAHVSKAEETERISIKKLWNKLVQFVQKNRFITIGIAVVAVIVIVVAPLFRPQKELRVIFFDVGQGDSHLITTPSGQNILVDGGPDKTVLERLGHYLPSINNTIDLMVLTHPHADHVTGLIEVMKRYKVDRVLATGVVHTSDVYLEWLSLIKERNIIFDRAAVLRKYVFETKGEPVILEVLYPFDDIYGQTFDDVNESSVVLMLEYKDKKFLFTGDISTENEKEIINKFKCHPDLARLAEAPAKQVEGSRQFDDSTYNEIPRQARNDKCNILDAYVLKVPHQGSDTSSSVEFLEAVKPLFAVIPVGENDYGHPSLRVIRRLERIGIKILQTNIHGDIEFVVDKNGSVQLKD